jgi:hypothetical protein
MSLEEVSLDHQIHVAAEQLPQLDPHLAEVEQQELAVRRNRDHDVDIAFRASLAAGQAPRPPAERDPPFTTNRRHVLAKVI